MSFNHNHPILILILFVFFVSSCSEEDTVTKTAKDLAIDAILGSWKVDSVQNNITDERIELSACTADDTWIYKVNGDLTYLPGDSVCGENDNEFTISWEITENGDSLIQNGDQNTASAIIKLNSTALILLGQKQSIPPTGEIQPKTFYSRR